MKGGEKMENKKVSWQMSNRLIEYFASSIYGQGFSVIAVRELLQNAYDAQAKNFELRIDTERDVKVSNDGKSMDLSTIEKALFTLGESTKENTDNAGFFGVGECAVIAPSETWKIESGKYVIENYELRENDKTINGTVHTLKLKKNMNGYEVKRFLAYHDLPMKITVMRYGNNEVLPRKTYRKCRKYQIPHGFFTWVKSGENLTVIRVKGVPQHIQYRYDNAGAWIIDLDTSTILTVNRESVRDSETLTAIDRISAEIRAIADHVGTDSEEKYITESTEPLYLRKRGYVTRRDVNSKPVRKLYECLKIACQFFSTETKQTLKFGMMSTDKTVRAMLKNDTILINIEDRKLFPSTSFVLTLLDDFSHEVAHVRQGFSNHAEIHTQLRRTYYNKPQIITQLRDVIRKK